MRGDRGEMRKDKDIKWERIYEMRIKDNGDSRGEERVCGLWLIPVLLIWQLHGC